MRSLHPSRPEEPIYTLNLQRNSFNLALELVCAVGDTRFVIITIIRMEITFIEYFLDAKHRSTSPAVSHFILWAAQKGDFLLVPTFQVKKRSLKRKRDLPTSWQPWDDVGGRTRRPSSWLRLRLLSLPHLAPAWKGRRADPGESSTGCVSKTSHSRVTQGTAGAAPAAQLAAGRGREAGPCTSPGFRPQYMRHCPPEVR